MEGELIGRPGLSGLRGGQKRMWLRLNQKEIADYWWRHGTTATTTEFRIGQNRTLESLLDRAEITLWEGWEYYEGYTGDDFPIQIADESPVVSQKQKNWLIQYLPYAELVRRQDPYGLGGMAKHKWLQLHRYEVMEYYRGHGFAATCSKYHCNHETLEHHLGVPHDKKGKAKWKEAIPIPRDHIEIKVDFLNERVMEEIEWRRSIQEQDAKLRKDIYAFFLTAFSGIAGALDKALPGIGALIREELQNLPHMMKTTPLSKIVISELHQALVETEDDQYTPGGITCPRCAGRMFPDNDARADVCVNCGSHKYWDKSPILTTKGV